ncbi:MAG TPA: hypothetical protein VGN20_28710 [Mucilaginibacter sp.]|jgi:hypothetical protein
MKKLVLVSLILTAVCVYSCKKSSGPNNTPNNTSNTNYKSLIAGKWYFTLDTIKHSINGGPFTIIGTSVYNRTEFEQFNPDGTGSGFYNGSYNFTYSITGNTVTLYYPAQIENLPGGSITLPADTQKATIRSISDNQLSILYYGTDVINATTETTYEAQYFSR